MAAGVFSWGCGDAGQLGQIRYDNWPSKTPGNSTINPVDGNTAANSPNSIRRSHKGGDMMPNPGFLSSANNKSLNWVHPMPMMILKQALSKVGKDCYLGTFS
ncbi:unnamed protein product [Protopolystoma xenopodis]|uniref:Uncharacterized protein n=1 Tax=Protopolystoma xenopodis TaxID=117903 RepID=A0A3S5CMA0_9PLAT|nr:unnamed protein product [Protopolystoma xenopodis]